MSNKTHTVTVDLLGHAEVKAALAAKDREIASLKARLDVVVQASVDAIAEAVKEEREACVLAVEDCEPQTYAWCGTTHDDGRATLKVAASAIRARARGGK